jgi:O-antigen/teichoic acid export membrane protein
MRGEFTRFSVKIIVAALALTIIGAALFYFYLPDKYLPVLPWMLLFFMFVTILSYGLQYNMAKKDVGKFVRSSMLTSLLRLVIYSTFAIIYLAWNNEDAAVFVVCLVVVYITFTSIEVIDLARITRR